MNYSIEQLLETEITENFLFFWGHTPSKDGQITKACLSQWWVKPFTENEHTFHSAEHYMMAGKALLFEDNEAFNKIINEPSPKNVKALGRKVKDFYQFEWEKDRYSIVVHGNYLKFSQNPKLKEYLLSTENQIIVEASPYDRIWGIGMTQDDKRGSDPNQWQGLNLLGFALMEVRDRLRK